MVLEDRDRITEEIDLLRKRFEELQGERAQVWRRLYDLRGRVVSAQGERCAYCGVGLRPNRPYESRHEPYPAHDEGRVEYQIRLKVPKSRGGPEVMENLVACCWECGRRKHTKTHAEFLRLLEAERAGAAAAQHGSPLRLVPPGGAGPS
ncbi:MAG: HNH endonuclease [Acidobacteriota bacterium]|nr:HNH endonuclease [Acidobacteriota bacterium]